MKPETRKLLSEIHKQLMLARQMVGVQDLKTADEHLNKAAQLGDELEDLLLANASPTGRLLDRDIYQPQPQELPKK